MRSFFFALVLLGCPERTVPERGLQLVYKKPSPDSIRSVADRRLARLKLRANLQEDGSTLIVRVKEGADLSRIKALFAQPAHLEFCSEDSATAAQWCDTTWPEGISAESSGTACALQGATRKDLARALPDAGVAFGTTNTRASAYAISSCITPHIVAAELEDPEGTLFLEFDRASAREFATLTQATVGRRLIIRLDGLVKSAPVVQEPITGGKAMLITGTADRAANEVLAAALVGGPLPVLELMREETWGPPSLKR